MFSNKLAHSKIDGAPTKEVLKTSNRVHSSSLLILGEAMGSFPIKESRYSHTESQWEGTLWVLSRLLSSLYFSLVPSART